MSYLLNISSNDRQAGQATDNFTVGFSPALRIPRNYEISLHSCSLWYSWYNIAAQYNNQSFRYNNGSTWKTITITPGLYSLPDINTFVQNAMLANGDFTNVGGVNQFYITLTPDYNTFKCLITISNSYQVDLTVGNLYQLLGFTSIIVSSTQEGVNNVNITNGVDKVLLHIDCITGSYVGGASSDVIFSFSADVSPSSLIEITPTKLIFLPLTQTGYLDKMRVYITDQSGNRLNLNGEQVNVTLFMRPM